MDQRTRKENQLMAKALTTDLSWQQLGEIACLLQLAADQLWEAADTAGVDSPLHSLGLGSLLAASQATEMLPAHREVPDHSPSESSDALRVLEAAEQLTRQLDPRMAGASDLSLTVADLVREARHSAA
jgi:hypothetical protein